MVIFIVFAQGINVEEEHNLEEAFKKASKLYEEGNLRESLNIYAKILEQQPNSPIANNNVAFILTKFGKYAEALHFFSSCLKEDPKNISYFQGYINTLIRLGKMSEARSVFIALKENYKGSDDQLKSLNAELNPELKLDFFYKYLEGMGIFECKPGEIMQINSNPIPLLTNSFINWFETQLWSDKKLLELGSGSSTFYFSNFFQSITSYENNQDWYLKMFEKKPKSVQLNYTKCIIDSLQNENINDFDVLLLDLAENRAKISRFLASENFKGIIIFDNSEWYRNSIRILESVGYYEIPFFGIKPVEDWVSSTSLLIREKDISKVLKSDWQRIPKFSSYKPSNPWDDELA